MTCFWVGVTRKISCTSRRMSNVVVSYRHFLPVPCYQRTNLVKHLVTLIEHKALDVAQAKVLVANEGVKTTRGGDDDVRVGLLVLEDVDVVLDGSTAVEHSSLDVRQVLAETCILVLDLESQLAGVAHNQDGALAVNGLDLLEGGQDEDGSFTKTRLGLAENVGSEDGLRDAVLLDCGHESQKFVQGILTRAMYRASCPSISEIKLRLQSGAKFALLLQKLLGP
jgi:hypothetical protein